MEEIFGAVDFSFKYILLGFNFLTLLVVYLHKRSRKVTREHHLLFVTAHPDDEVMFFGPTLASVATDYFVHLLCLSGRGSVREEELRLSAQNLALHRFECVGHPKLEDGLKEKWCEETIRELVGKYVSDHGIRAIFTFDGHGVSGHPNHQAIYRSLSACETEEDSKPAEIKAEIKPEKAGEAEKVEAGEGRKAQETEAQQNQSQKQVCREVKALKIYYLQSTNLLRKYTGCLQILVALLRDFSWVRLNYISAWQAMKFHSSQFNWYRKLWVLFSRYTYVNTYCLRRVRLP